jgi:protease-4
MNAGLVDELGGLQDALNYAKKLIKSKDKSVIYYPRIKENSLERLIRLMDSENGLETKSLLSHPLLNQLDKNIRKIEQMHGIQMRMPYDIEIN